MIKNDQGTPPQAWTFSFTLQIELVGWRKELLNNFDEDFKNTPWKHQETTRKPSKPCFKVSFSSRVFKRVLWLWFCDQLKAEIMVFWWWFTAATQGGEGKGWFLCFRWDLHVKFNEWFLKNDKVWNDMVLKRVDGFGGPKASQNQILLIFD